MPDDITQSIVNLAARVRQLEALEIPTIGGGGGTAPDNATYLTLTNNASLTAERRFIDGTDLTGTDLGANSTYTLDHDDTAIVPGAYGDATHVATFTVNQRGHLTKATDVLIAGVAPSVHNVLDSTYHGDVLTGAITRGDILYGNATPKIARLAKGGAGAVLTGDGTDTAWSTYFLSGTAGQTYTFGTTGGTISTSPGTLTVATANATTAAGVHTHAITSSSNPGAAASILASDASGYLRLTGMGVGATPTATRIFYSSISSASVAAVPVEAITGTITAAPAGASSSDFRGGFFYAATSGAQNIATVRGLFGQLQHAGTGTLTSAQGLSFSASNNSSGQITTLYGCWAGAVQAGTNTVGTMTAVVGVSSVTAAGNVTTGHGASFTYTHGGAGTTSNAAGCFLNVTKTAGTITTGYGLYISAITAAATNYAIYSVGGQSVHAGNMRIGSVSAPSVVLHVSTDNATTNAVDELVRIQHDSTGTAAAGFGSALDWYLESSTTAGQVAARDSVLWTDATHASRTALRRYSTIGNTANTGYYGHWNYSAVAGTAITVIPNATGDVTEVLTCMYSVSAVTGGDAMGGVCVLEPSDSFSLYSDGTDTLTLAVAADGSVTVQRTAGADTFKVSLWMNWI